MSAIDSRTALSADKRKLFELMLRKKGIAGPQIDEIGRRAAGTRFPCSYSQERIWSLAHIDGAQTVYLIRSAIRLMGALDAGALQAALDVIVARHEILRTSFTEIQGRPLQAIAQECGFPLEFSDCSDREPAEQEASIRQAIAKEECVPFDLRTGLLIRGRLIRMSGQQHVLLITTHQLVHDGWSRALLLRELGALYAAYRRGEGNSHPPLQIQYADYAQWHRRQLAGDVLRRGLEYWTRYLSGAPKSLVLPADRPRSHAKAFPKGGAVHFTLKENVSAKLKLLARKHDTTLFTVLYVGWAILLSLLSEQDDLVIGVPASNRQHTQLERLIGNFVNFLPLRVQLTDGVSIATLIRRVRDTMHEAYAHREVPFSEIVAAQGLPLDHRAIYQVSFNLPNVRRGVPRLPGLTLAPRESPIGNTDKDLSMILLEHEKTVVGIAKYAVDLFDHETVEGWVRRFEAILASMVHDMETQLKDLRTCDIE